ncbi:MAG TPA: helix-turn-helix domain-containing protein [Actinophytocola sp.]|uniref:helix-turn-helix domain-containing protein n=1 Tax=Actinophytocola sp. TaxID=1872138 RepID=UPI002DDDB9D5|nr:helix-turn-helix domain-containing protein [Actinophytocola sp.]HEV2780890.1 helix-turn-helix domain-containing protein [Actinophytocola sp.]
MTFRSKIVLACAEGAANKDVAATLGTREQTVAKWRGRFVRRRLDGLSDEPRPGAPRKITDEQVEKVITKTLEQAPARGDTHWSTRSMAQSVGMSQTTISRIWRAFGLKPHLVQTWNLPTDPQFVAEPGDLVGLCLDPPDKALLLRLERQPEPFVRPNPADEILANSTTKTHDPGTGREPSPRRGAGPAQREPCRTSRPPLRPR